MTTLEAHLPQISPAAPLMLKTKLHEAGSALGLRIRNLFNHTAFCCGGSIHLAWRPSALVSKRYLSSSFLSLPCSKNPALSFLPSLGFWPSLHFCHLSSAIKYMVCAPECEFCRAARTDYKHGALTSVIHSLTVWEARSPNSGCQQGH